jgi:hypothetical protein
VRFDKEYSYGDEHDAWKDFAGKVGGSSAEMLVGDVGVSEYGDKDNSDISDRYSIKSDDFPQYRLCARRAPQHIRSLTSCRAGVVHAVCGASCRCCHACGGVARRLSGWSVA